MPTALDHLKALRKEVTATVRPLGYRVASGGQWRRGDDESGWTFLTWRGDRRNTKAEAGVSLWAAVWPAGTREHLSRLRGHHVDAAAAADAPLIGTARDVVGDAAAGNFDVRADEDPATLADLGARAVDVARRLAAWAETMVDPRVSAPSMREDMAVASLLVCDPESAEIDLLLDQLTAGFQRAPRPFALRPFIEEWRAGRGLAPVPLPQWFRPMASRPPHPAVRSPRDEFLAGIGTAVDFQYADGTTRKPCAEDLPDEQTLVRWREERRASPVPDGVLSTLPEWLPYADWLDR